MNKIELPLIRVIPWSVGPADFNMALDEYLLSLEQPVLRFYGWEKPTLSFGKSRKRLEEIDIEFCRDAGIAGVQRRTGGKTVLHQHELTYSFSANTEKFPRSIVETYRHISQPLADAFLKFGLEPDMKEEKRGADNSSICFNEVSSYELTIKGKKIVGSAQYRQRKRFIQHGSILLDIDWELWKSIWMLPADSTLLENRITTFKEELGNIPAIETLADKITQSFAEYFAATVEVFEPNREEMEKIESLREKYQWDLF